MGNNTNTSLISNANSNNTNINNKTKLIIDKNIASKNNFIINIQNFLIN